MFLLLLLALRLLGICKHNIASSRTERRRNGGIREEVVTKRRWLEFFVGNNRFTPFSVLLYRGLGEVGQYPWVKMRHEGGGKTTALLMLFSELCFALEKNVF